MYGGTYPPTYTPLSTYVLHRSHDRAAHRAKETRKRNATSRTEYGSTVAAAATMRYGRLYGLYAAPSPITLPTYGGTRATGG